MHVMSMHVRYLTVLIKLSDGWMVATLNSITVALLSLISIPPLLPLLSYLGCSNLYAQLSVPLSAYRLLALLSHKDTIQASRSYFTMVLQAHFLIDLGP